MAKSANAPARQRAKMQRSKKGGQNHEIKKGNWELYYYYYIFIFIYYLLSIIYLRANIYARLLYILSSCAYLYARFLPHFILVIDSKAQHSAKKRHSKKPL